MSRYHALRVRAVVDETHDTKSVAFDVPPELASTFAYQPGQFLTLRLGIDGRHVPRCYSMSAGDTIEVLPPSGVFHPRSLEGDFLLLAGGSGITPVFSILRSVLAKGTGRITLLYANRDEKSVIFKKELKALAEAHPSRLSVIHWLDSVQGVPSVAQLAELARHHCAAQAFICGPGPYMDAAVAALQAVEMPSERIHVERFASLPDEETLAAATAIAQAAPPLPGAVDEAVVEVLLDGETHILHCSGNETLLEAALKAGLNAPYSCQAGMCASCMCQVVEGSVHQRAVAHQISGVNPHEPDFRVACRRPERHVPLVTCARPARNAARAAAPGRPQTPRPACHR